jgi:hypothetical protein
MPEQHDPNRGPSFAELMQERAAEEAAHEAERAAREAALREHVAENGPTQFWLMLAGLAPRASSPSGLDGTYRSGPCPVWIKVRNPASIAVQRERSEN